jgi:hypothetical protein
MERKTAMHNMPRHNERKGSVLTQAKIKSLNNRNDRVTNTLNLDDEDAAHHAGEAAERMIEEAATTVDTSKARHELHESTPKARKKNNDVHSYEGIEQHPGHARSSARDPNDFLYRNETPETTMITHEHEPSVRNSIAASPEYFDDSMWPTEPAIELFVAPKARPSRQDIGSVAREPASSATSVGIYPQLYALVNSVPDEMWRQPASVTMDDLDEFDVLMASFPNQEEVQTLLEMQKARCRRSGTRQT